MEQLSLRRKPIIQPIVFFFLLYGLLCDWLQLAYVPHHPPQTQDIIDSKLDKRRKGVLGPPLGMTCVIFVDDLNMPAKETYGAQPPIEILRQWMDHGGWYDRKENTFRQLVDVQFVAAMGPPGGGRTSITQRYVRHFNLLNFVPFSNESLHRVFGTILDWFLQRGFNSTVKQVRIFY